MNLFSVSWTRSVRKNDTTRGLASPAELSFDLIANATRSARFASGRNPSTTRPNEETRTNRPYRPYRPCTPPDQRKRASGAGSVAPTNRPCPDVNRPCSNTYRPYRPWARTQPTLPPNPY